MQVFFSQSCFIYSSMAEITSESSKNTSDKVSHMKSYLEEKYARLKQQTIARTERRKTFESTLQNELSNCGDINQTQIDELRNNFDEEEAEKIREDRKILRKEDFEPLELIGRGAFGEVVLVRVQEGLMKNVSDNRIFGK